MKKRYGIIKPHPKLEWVIANLGGGQIPTKQDKFKPLIGYKGVIIENGVEIELDELYVKSPDKEAIRNFETELKLFITKNLSDQHPYKKPQHLEVILSFLTSKKRFFEVDIDNLSKNILDCLKGLVFEDDSQVVRLLSMKDTHPDNISNGLVIGINKVDKINTGWFGDIKLLYAEEIEVDEV